MPKKANSRPLPRADAFAKLISGKARIVRLCLPEVLLEKARQNRMRLERQSEESWPLERYVALLISIQ